MFPKLLKSRLKRKQTKVNLRISCCFKPDAYVMAAYLLNIMKELEKISRISLEKEELY